MLQEQQRLRKNVEKQFAQMRADATPNKHPQRKGSKARAKTSASAVHEGIDSEGSDVDGLPTARLQVSLYGHSALRFLISMDSTASGSIFDDLLSTRPARIHSVRTYARGSPP